MIDLEDPKSKTFGVLSRKALSKPRGGRNLEVVHHDHRPDRRLVQRQKKRVLALRGIRRAIDQNQPGALQALKRFALRGDIERFDRPEAVPAASQRNDFRKIRLAFRDPSLELLRTAEPIRGVLDAGRRDGRAPEGVGGAPRTEFKRTASRRQKRRDLLEKPAARERKNPRRSFAGRLRRFVIFLDELRQPSFERSVGRSQIGVSDNPSELLSTFRHVSEVSARF